MKKLLTVLCLCFYYVSFAQSQQQVIDTLFQGASGLASKAPDVGVVVGIYHKGQTRYYAFGTRRTGETEPPDSTTIFEIGSATKTFTALLLAEAIQHKKVGERDFIDRYLPKGFHLPDALKNKIRLTDLAAHRSGLPNLSSDSYFEELLRKDGHNPFRFVDSAYLYTVLGQTDSLHHYGQYQYNNFAFSLLGDLLARIYHKNYADLLAEKILDPLQMQHTTLAIQKVANVAGLYNQQGAPQEYLILDAVNPAGGLKSNAVDLMKYLKVHVTKNAYTPAIKRTQKPYLKDAKHTVGLGWDIAEGYYQKDGDTFGNSMLMRYDPAQQLAIVVLLNHQNGQLASDVVDFIYNRLRR